MKLLLFRLGEVNKVLSLFKNDLKQLKNVIVIFISCFLLNYLIGIMSFDKDIIRVMFYLTVFIFSLIIPMINLQYLFNSTKQTHFNSLPITRIQGFIVHYLSGIICLIIPTIIYCWLMKLNCLDLLLLIFVYYSLVNLTAYCTTSFITNIILLLAIILIPIVLYLSLFGIFTTYIRGVVFDGLSLNVVKYLLPFIGFIIDVENVIELKDVLVYLGYILIILFLAICACKYRRLENSYHGFSYKFVANVIILLIIVSISWAILSIIGMNYVTAKEFIALNIIITLIVVFIIQFIRYRKVRYGLYALQTIAISIITTCIFFSSMDYIENYIPTSIKAVAINPISNNQNTKLKDQQSIDKIVNIHQQLLASEDGNHEVNVTYYTNRAKIVRKYNVSEKAFNNVLNEIDDNLLKSWLNESYQLLKALDQNSELVVYDNDETYLNEDIELFKSILKTKLNDFENDRALINQINYVSGYNNVDVIKNKTIKTFMYYPNDPIALTIKEINKIKAN